MDELIKQIAWQAIQSSLGVTNSFSKYEAVKLYPEFVLPRATFITLKIDGQLRGCIGSLIAHRELFDDLVTNAKKAAFEDPRFRPVSVDELPNISLEVSILTPPTLVEYQNIEDLKSKITIGVDGVILKQGENQATFLPQVWEDIKDFDTFFIHLCKKARLDGNCLDNHPQIYKYQAKKIK
ncbi:MAG: AmmeMemoRadiSam system protein A [Arcobacteraceae bacterium]|jgi:AmmeMemoRadiSam system protein A|nr:AmmeMemoRadiSam system protein A [Arcobacteraceae bacterium]